jgi:hypothetical protein
LISSNYLACYLTETYQEVPTVYWIFCENYSYELGLRVPLDATLFDLHNSANDKWIVYFWLMGNPY